MATCFVHPMDVLKNRMQMQGEGGKAREYKTSMHLLSSIVRNEGVTAAYSGISAGFLRQCTYATARLGIYTVLFEKMSTTTKSGKRKPPSFYEKMAIAAVAGGAGAAVGTPAEVCLVRMTTDGRLPAHLRRNYRNVFHALYRVAAEEGLAGVFRGIQPTIVRSVVTNVAQLVTYSQAKELLLSTGYFKDNIITHFGAGMASGLVTAFASLPPDMAKTRIQNMNVVAGGRVQYHGMTDVIVSVARNEGIGSLWKGFTPYYMRIGPHTVLTLIFLEQLSGAYAKYILGQEKIGGI